MGMKLKTRYANPYSHIQFYKLTKPSLTAVIKG